MGIGAYYGPTEGNAQELLTYAADRGMTFWDCADIYGSSEEELGKWFASTGRRKDVFLATKFGARDPEAHSLASISGGPISKPSYIKRAFARSLKNLQTDYVDLYYQHRVDTTVPIEIVLEALREFVENGKIKWIGLSECSADTLKRAKAVKVVGEKVITAQMEFGPFELFVEKRGFAEEAEKLGVGIVAYSPLGRGLVSGRFRSRADFAQDDIRLFLPRFSEESFPKNIELTDKIKAIGEKYGASSSQVSLAWILAEHSTFIPIPGCRTIERLEDNAKGAELPLSAEDVKAIRSLVEAADVQGERYPPAILANCEVDSLALSEWKGEV
ncbi:Aldo/keto reductase [Schizopora paradoxa]|uniref:Aldo/keto reductase n=1 Tax=Schizopora paradoxa TaxID=27342 RepID=A0A0H2S3C5_9AGAM|nr:Aldo/keto reductase [Schizopora paradoxa]